MFVTEQYLNELRARFESTGVDPTFLGKPCEYYFVIRDLAGGAQGIGGIEGVITAVRPGVVGQLFVDIAVASNMPELYVVKENIAVWHKGESVACPGWPLFFEYNCKTFIDSYMEQAIQEHKKKLSTATNQERHLKLVKNPENPRNGKDGT